MTNIDFAKNARSIILNICSEFIKIILLKTFESQRYSMRCKKGKVTYYFTCNDDDALLFLTYQVPSSKSTSKGFSIPYILLIKADNRLSSILPVFKFILNGYYIIVIEYIKNIQIIIY